MLKNTTEMRKITRKGIGQGTEIDTGTITTTITDTIKFMYELCFQMAYIQLSLYGIPARVMLGDTLAYKFKQSIYTPMYFINNFEYKLKRYEKQKEQSKDNNNQQFKDLKEITKTADIYFEDDRIKIRPKNSSNLALNGTSNEIYYVPYEISTDLTTITIQNRQYKIPNWYNKEMIKQKDQKTLEMILISL